jgi:Zn-dependent peptidase ImmA (M78 family)
VPIKNHSKAELEQIADDFLNRWGRGKYDGNGRSLRVEALIEGYGYHIWPVPNLAQIAEAYIPVKAGYIFVDEDQYLNPWSFRVRFTLTEELAHVLLHRPIFEGKDISQIIIIQQAITDAEYRTIERNAKYLAGAILMRRHLFKERFAFFFRQQSLRSSNRLQILKFVVRELSRDFNVSCYTVAIRARDLDLIDQQQLDDLMEENQHW